jgi:tRNA threonylcarbamoyladenosine biosynthesis protein TsaB
VETSVNLVSEVLEDASLGPGDLDGVAVSLGPGSFTGLRVGLGIAKGICMGANLPLAGVPTLDCMARPLGGRDGLIIPVRDARRGEVYCCVYRSRRGEVERAGEYVSLAPSDFIDMVKKAEQAEALPVVLVGDGLAKYGEALRDGLPNAEFAAESFWNVRASVVGTIGLELMAAGNLLDLDRAEPLYVRASEAERKRYR